MKVRIIVAMTALALAAGCAGTAKIKPHLADVTVSEKEAAKAEAEPSFSRLTVGEKFTYLVTWKGIPIGSVTSVVEELTKLGSYDVYKIKVTARTNKFLSKLFPVEDMYTSYADRDKLISRRYEATLREGRYKKDLVVDYDSAKDIATYKNLRDNTVKTCPTSPDTRDPVAAAYFARTLPVRVGDTIEINVNLCENNYTVYGSIEKKVHVEIRTLGVFDAFLIKPYIKLKGKVQKRAKAWGYVSADEKRLPLYMLVRVLEIPWIGEVAATLRKVECVSAAQY